MTYSPGDWVRLEHDVPGGSSGQRGKVTGTSFLGNLDIELTTGVRLRDVDPMAVTHAARPAGASDDGGCLPAAAAVGAGAAGLVVAAAAAWSRMRWG